ncbi:membrane protein [Bordetella ansorpii]|uniref:diguanylate cyclase n=1 Tax=Bordetella ansorpii TaxID=288768 RepID=A0A157Q1J4_9BORD|nr:diguanylate cyclase [Bordetella ansorpii]SAI39752.1 membrane protein [Bordetella ansorpii]
MTKAAIAELLPADGEIGHAVGDRALATFAAVLRTFLRNRDVIARLGGGEFVVLLTDASGDDAARIDPQRDASVQALRADADASMYGQKRLGKAGR